VPAIQSQRSLFEEARVEVTKPEPKTRVQVGTRVAEIPLARKRRAALLQLMPILEQLEGKDIYVGSYWSSHNHFWANNLKLGRLQLEIHKGGNDLPSVIVLWGSREASVRIFRPARRRPAAGLPGLYPMAPGFLERHLGAPD